MGGCTVNIADFARSMSWVTEAAGSDKGSPTLRFSSLNMKGGVSLRPGLGK